MWIYNKFKKKIICRLRNWFKYPILVHDISDSTRISRQYMGYNIEPNRSRFYWRCTKSFFIESAIDRNRNKKKKLLDHYDKLKVDVLDRWINQSTQLHKKIDDMPNSPIPLYVKLSDGLKSMYFNRLRSHLKTAYKESDSTTLPYKRGR